MLFRVLLMLWYDATGSPGEAWETLTPYPDDLMVAWPGQHAGQHAEE
jgi:hypothetical protein